MKLLYCGECHDVFNLMPKPKSCECGHSSGQYIDDINAVYSGQYAIPFAIDNGSFLARVRQMDDRELIYDAFYGEGKIYCWILREGAQGFETIAKIGEELCNLRESLSRKK